MRDVQRRLAVLLGATLVVAVLAAVTTVIALRTSAEQGDRGRALADRVAISEELTEDVERYLAAGRHYLLSGDPADRKRVKVAEHQLATTRERVAGAVRGGGGPLEATELDRALAGLTSVMTEAIVERPLETDPKAAELVEHELVPRLGRLEGDLVPRYDAYTASLARVVAVHREDFTASAERARRFATTARWTVIAISALALGFAAAFGLLLVRTLRGRARAQLPTTEPPASEPPSSSPRVLTL